MRRPHCSIFHRARRTVGGPTRAPGCGSNSTTKNPINRGAFLGETAHGKREDALLSTCEGIRVMSEASIFATALEKAGGEERAAYLAGACAGDVKLRRRVEALLRAHAEPDEILDAPEPRACTVDE